VPDPLDSRAHRFDWVTPNDALRVVGWGLPAAMIVAAAVLGTIRWRENRLTRIGTEIGDASYALYLCHPIVMGLFSACWFALRLNHVISPWIALLASIGVASVVAVLVHRWIEQPMTDRLKTMKRARSYEQPREAARRIAT
jgi:exopolysaccharide production protein ExoZ